MGNINSEYRINEDGSITHINNGGNGKNNNSGGSSGIKWFILIAIIIGIVIAIANSESGSSSQDSDIVEDTVVEVVDATPSTTYLRVSDDDIYMNSDGGSEEITIYTDGDWYINVDVAAWGHLTKYSDSVILKLDKNTSHSSRTDYFEIKAGTYTKRVNITQYGNTDPSAEIDRVWVDHNVSQNGQQGMRVHVKFSVDNMNGKTVYAYVFFYWEDNTTPLHDAYGNNLSFYNYGTPRYDEALYEDFSIFVPYYGMNMQAGQGTVNLSFDVSIRNASSTELARDNNNKFTFSN